MRFVTQGLMRTIGVEVLSPEVEADLLFGLRRRRRIRHLLAGPAVHSFVAAILIRTAGRDPVGPDVEFQKPHRQDRQSAQAQPVGERAAVVGAQGRTGRGRFAVIDVSPHVVPFIIIMIFAR